MRQSVYSNKQNRRESCIFLKTISCLKRKESETVYCSEQNHKGQC